MNLGGNDHSWPTMRPTFAVIVRSPPIGCMARLKMDAGAVGDKRDLRA
jgi:hypothetical protein